MMSDAVMMRGAMALILHSSPLRTHLCLRDGGSVLSAGLSAWKEH